MCGNDFTTEYNCGSERVIHFCSKSCKTKFQRQGYFNKSQLEKAIERVIISENKYMTLNDITNKLKISSKTISRFRISILSINSNCGMKKPKSIFEKIVGEYLSEIISDIKYQVIFEECKSPKGFPLKFDFFSKKYNLIIEADGSQHGNVEHQYSTEYTLECDIIKDVFAKENNYKLIRIPYSRNVNKEYILKFINL